MPISPVFSHYTLAAAAEARRVGTVRCLLSPDLGLSQVDAQLTGEGLLLPGGEQLLWQDVDRILADDVGCYALHDGGTVKIQAFSETTQRALSLMPTADAPTLLVAGFPMHRIKDTDPQRDTQAKIKTLLPVTGRVLDCNMGLGYTAIAAARSAQSVLTVELDPGVVDVARQNPWSQALFTDPRITRVVGDVFDVALEQPDESFSRILHDPPTVQLAGDLYSADFYAELFRLLQRGGRLFHYIGDPNSQHGARFTPGVMARLEKVGFTRVTRQPKAFGVSAIKP